MVRHLNVAYGGVSVLAEVSADIPRDCITVVLGASGSGKTTLLRHMVGLAELEEGTMRLLGVDMAQAGEAERRATLRRVGMLFQEGALLNSISVFENVRVPLEQHTDLPDPIVDAVVRAKLGLVGLAGSESALPSELSGGMRKRAGLARAIALDPELLFCDEPTAGLDPVTSKAMDELLLDLRRSLGITVVVISHDVASVRRIADRVLFLHDGALLWSGSREEAEASEIPELVTYFASA
jgi:phospholipid/cholesterol/gamma-HCH transport system ATP-binding protein